MPRRSTPVAHTPQATATKEEAKEIWKRNGKDKNGIIIYFFCLKRYAQISLVSIRIFSKNLYHPERSQMTLNSRAVSAYAR